MPISIILNGYYRSGTTFLWQTLKNEIHNHISVYEPLNPDIPWSMRKEAETREFFSLHNQPLWEFFYRNLNWQQQAKLLINHPNTGTHGINHEQALINYFDLIESYFPDQSIYLQTNRAHFFLDTLINKYNCKLIHIIRNPVYVYQSIINAFYKGEHNNFFKKGIKKVTGKITLGYAFEIDKEFHWIQQKLGYPYFFQETILFRLFHHFYNFEKFVTNWVISNYYALKHIENNGGLVLYYEDFLHDKNNTFNTINQYLGTNIDPGHVAVNKPKKIQNFNKIQRKFIKALEFNKITHEYAYLVSHFSKNCQEYPSQKNY